jgi:hypothetical protein
VPETGPAPERISSWTRSAESERPRANSSGVVTSNVIVRLVSDWPWAREGEAGVLDVDAEARPAGSFDPESLAEVEADVGLLEGLAEGVGDVADPGAADGGLEEGSCVGGLEADGIVVAGRDVGLDEARREHAAVEVDDLRGVGRAGRNEREDEREGESSDKA